MEERHNRTKGQPMSFCTAVNCIDGRVQLPVIDYLRKRFAVSYVDIISEAGPALVLAEQRESEAFESIMRRVSLSVKAHQSTGIAIVAHHDCAGNRASEETQLAHLRNALQYVARQHPPLEVVGLWVDSTWSVSEVSL